MPNATLFMPCDRLTECGMCRTYSHCRKRIDCEARSIHTPAPRSPIMWVGQHEGNSGPVDMSWKTKKYVAVPNWRFGKTKLYGSQGYLPVGS
jgi:hypothetical protein